MLRSTLGSLVPIIVVLTLGIASPLGAADALAVIDTEVFDGETFRLPVEGEWDDNVSGFTLAMTFPPNPPIENFDVEVNNSLVGELDPDFIVANVDLAAGELVYAVLFELAPPFTGTAVLPPVGFPLLLAEFTGSVPAGTPEQDVLFEFTDGLGDPPVNNIYVVDFASLLVELRTPGALQIREEIIIPDPVFLRGDANSDGGLDIGDVLFLLNWGFGTGDAPLCLDAVDVNDSGHADPFEDGFYLLSYLFQGGPAPLPPFPMVGPDPTPDSVSCEVSL